MKYGAPKAQMFAVVTFVEKYRAYLGSEPFKLRVDNRALSWLKTYSMDQSYIGRWIVRLDGYKTKFEIPNEYSENILITDSDFILSDRISAICITADMSFKSRLEADFKREYQNVEFLFRQRPGLGGMAALPPSVAQVPGKYLCFLVTRVNERNTIDPEHVMLALTRLKDFMIERETVEVSMPVYGPNRGKLSPRELYAILHVVFAETEIVVHLHKKYYLSIA